MHRDVGAEEAAAQGAGTLVVLNADATPIARASHWLVSEMDGQYLVAVPQLRVEHEAALRLIANTGLAELFKDCAITTPDWAGPAIIVGGAWQLWKTGKPILAKAGFVRGTSINIEHAVRGLSKMLREGA